MGERSGFTLIELLVVMAILGLLASITYGQFRTSQKKGRDAQRKTDLENIARALEIYYNDFQKYPESTNCAGEQVGKIVVEKNCPSLRILNWGESFQVSSGSRTFIYMKKLPADPLPTQSYCYEQVPDGFRLYAKLENKKDPQYAQSGYLCAGDSTYTYKVAGGAAD